MTHEDEMSIEHGVHSIWFIHRTNNAGYLLLITMHGMLTEDSYVFLDYEALAKTAKKNILILIDSSVASDLQTMLRGQPSSARLTDQTNST